MKKLIKKAAFLTFILSSVLSYSQEESIEIESNDSQKNAVTTYLGIPGYGVGYARQFNENLSLRGKFSFFSFDVSRERMNLSGRDVNLIGQFKYNTIDVLLDYNPFKKSSFKLVAGISYLYSAEFDAIIQPADPVVFGDITLTPENTGQINVGADWSGIAPYIGLGFGRAVPKKNIGFGFDIGGHFTGKPKPKFTSTGLLTPTEKAEKADFDEWMEQFTFIPNLMFHLNYKF